MGRMYSNGKGTWMKTVWWSYVAPRVAARTPGARREAPSLVWSLHSLPPPSPSFPQA